MASPRSPRRRDNLDHITDALVLLEQAEACLDRIDVADMDAPTHAAVATVKARMAEARRATALAMEQILPADAGQKTAVPIVSFLSPGV